MTYKEFLLVLSFDVKNKLILLRDLLTTKLNLEAVEADFYVDSKTSQKVEVGYREWRCAEEQFSNLVQFVRGMGVDLDSVIPVKHQKFPFEDVNLN